MNLARQLDIGSERPSSPYSYMWSAPETAKPAAAPPTTCRVRTGRIYRFPE